jgi:hypothetical protein
MACIKNIAADCGLDGRVQYSAGTRDSVLYSTHTGSGTHPASCPTGTGGFFSKGESAGV